MSNGLVIGVLLLASAGASQYDIFESRRQHSIEIQREKVECIRIYQKFGSFNLYNFQQISKLSSDRWGGYIDPVKIREALFYFTDRKAQLDTEIRKILSELPDSKRCKIASYRAITDVQAYTRHLVNPSDMSSSPYENDSFHLD